LVDIEYDLAFIHQLQSNYHESLKNYDSVLSYIQWKELPETEADKLWLNSYPPGFSTEVNCDEHPSLISLFEDVFVKYKDRIAFSCMGADLTY
jgi:hypothetical protein